MANYSQMQRAIQTGLPFSPNNGNPGGVNNSAPGQAPRAGTTPAIPTYLRRNNLVQGSVDMNGQHASLGRYRAPQLDAQGNQVGGDMGGYAYNLPNSFGSPFDYRANRQTLGSSFNPERMRGQLGGGGSTSNTARPPREDSTFQFLQQLLQRQSGAQPVSARTNPFANPAGSFDNGVGPMATRADVYTKPMPIVGGMNKPAINPHLGIKDQPSRTGPVLPVDRGVI